MNFTRRISLVWRLLRVVPKLEYLESALPTAESLKWAIPKLEALDHLQPRLEALNAILERLEALDKCMPNAETLNTMVSRFESLDGAVSKIEQLGPMPKPVTVTIHQNGSKPVATIDKTALEEKHEWERLKLLARFAGAAGKAREIELEWQQIQQDENDANFAFQTLNKGNPEGVFLYKKGIADGIKWVINRFS